MSGDLVPTVRRAAPSDVPWLVSQLRDFDRFFGSSVSLFPDEAYAQQMLYGLIGEQPFFVADRAGRAIGFIAGHLAPHPFNPNVRVLTELFWWVEEAERQSRAGHLLLDAFVSVGRTQADLVVFTLEAKSPVNPRTLERRGFRLYEQNYLLEVR